MNPDNTNPTPNLNPTPAPEPMAPPVPPASPVNPPAPEPAAPMSASSPIDIVSPVGATPATPTPAPANPTADPMMAGATPDMTSPNLGAQGTAEPAPEAPIAPAAPAPEEPPIEPAAPVPGSIGSEVSMPAAGNVDFNTPAADTNPMPTMQPAKKKSKSTLILVIVLVVILLGVGGYFLWSMFGSQLLGNSDNPNGTNPTPAPTPAVTESVAKTLTCKISETFTAVEGAEATTVAAASRTGYIVASYEDEVLSDIVANSEYTYADAETATADIAAVEKLYTDYLAQIGLESDPFTSSYVTEGNAVKTSHIAEAELLDATNAAVFGIEVAGGQLATAPAAYQTSLENAGYVCVVE